MKRYIFVLMIITLFLGGCRSLTKKGRSVNKAEKLFEAGNYYGSVEILSNTLVTEPEYEPAIELLNEAFPLALDYELNQVSSYTGSKDYITLALKTEKVFNLYKFSARLRAETQGYLSFPVEYEKLKEWTQKTAKAYYNAGKNFGETDNLADYKTIAKLYKKSYTYHPRYMDSLDKYKEYKELAMQKLVYFPADFSYGYYNIGSIINDGLLNKLKSDSGVMEFTQLNNLKDLGLKRDYTQLGAYNRVLEVEVMGVDYRNPSLSQDFYTRRWYEEIKTVDGVIYTNPIRYIPNPKTEGATYKEHIYTEVHNEKFTSAKISIKYKLYDLLEDKTISEGYVDKKVEDSTTWTTYWGDLYPGLGYESEGNLMDQQSMLKEAALAGVEEVFRKVSKELK